jgi:hypothetical protein
MSKAVPQTCHQTKFHAVAFLSYCVLWLLEDQLTQNTSLIVQDFVRFFPKLLQFWKQAPLGQNCQRQTASMQVHTILIGLHTYFIAMYFDVKQF